MIRVLELGSRGAEVDMTSDREVVLETSLASVEDRVFKRSVRYRSNISYERK